LSKIGYITCFVLLLGTPLLGHGQARYFAYDAAGNRVLRSIPPPRSARPAKDVGEPVDTIIEGGFAVWPNPVQQLLNITLPKGCIALLMADVEGKTVFSSRQHIPEIDVAALPGGMYFITAVLSDGSRQTRSIIVQH